MATNGFDSAVTGVVAKAAPSMAKNLRTKSESEVAPADYQRKLYDSARNLPYGVSPMAVYDQYLYDIDRANEDRRLQAQGIDRVGVDVGLGRNRNPNEVGGHAMPGQQVYDTLYLDAAPRELMYSIREDMENSPDEGGYLSDDLLQVASDASNLFARNVDSDNEVYPTQVSMSHALQRLEKLAALDPEAARDYRRLIEDAGELASYYGIGQGGANANEAPYLNQQLPEKRKKKSQ